MIAGRPVACLAILTAFSTASAPELNSAERFSWSPGVRRASSSQTDTYSSYGVTMKQVWVNRSACSRIPAVTRGALLPTDVTAIPEPKSISELPSTSMITPPPALMKMGRTWLTPRATLASRRTSSSRDAGPGISVTRRRTWARPGPPCRGDCMVIQETISHEASAVAGLWAADSPPPPVNRPAEGSGGRRDGGHGGERVPGPVPQRHPGQRGPGWHGQRQVATPRHDRRADPLGRPVGQGGHRGRGPGIDQPGVGDDARLGREYHRVQRGRGRWQPDPLG